MSTYLLIGIILSALGLAVLPFARLHAKVALLSGLFAAPLGFLDRLYYQEYWSPPYILGPAISIEGVLFIFGNCIFLWLVAVAPYWQRVTYTLNPWNIISRCLACCLLWISIVFLIWHRGAALFDVGILTSTVVGLLGCIVFILWRRPDVWPLSISGAVGFGCLYSIQLAVISMADPTYSEAFASTIKSGRTIFGFPIEEIAWATVFGGAWAPAVAYGCNGRIS